MRHCMMIYILLMFSTFTNAEVTNAGGREVSSGQLEVIVSNIQNAKGTLVLAIFNKADYWLDSKSEEPPFKDAAYRVTSTDNAVVVIENLPVGSYAISIFHDINENKKMDTNFIGFPKEPFAFSAPMGKFGPPKYEKASFRVEQGINQIEIALN